MYTLAKASILAAGIAGLITVSTTSFAQTAAPQPAQPEETRGGRGGMRNAISLLGNLGYGYGLGVGVGAGVRYQATIVPKGFLRKGNIVDDLGIEGGFDFLTFSDEIDSINLKTSVTEYRFAATAIWNVWFTDRFAAYPRVGLSFGLATIKINDDEVNDSSYGGIGPVYGVGAVYKFGALAVRAEFTGATTSAGLAITF